jgi:hypothetical protein
MSAYEEEYTLLVWETGASCLLELSHPAASKHGRSSGESLHSVVVFNPIPGNSVEVVVPSKEQSE